MIRRLRLSDLAGQLLPGHSLGGDSAYTRAQLRAGRARAVPVDLVRSSLSATPHVGGFTTGGRDLSVIVVHRRAGPRAWEVRHLWPGNGPPGQVNALIEHAAGFVARQRGERLFLRVRADDPVQQIAQQCGLFPAYQEELLFLPNALPKAHRSPSLALRRARASDEYSLFRLYTTAVPAPVRSAAAMTFDQWLDCREGAGGRADEYVWDVGDRLLAWLRLALRGRSLSIDALLRHDVATEASALLENAGWLAERHDRAAWVVPSFCPALAPLLKRQGWQLAETYAVMIRTVANRVTEPAFLPARA